LFKVRASDRGRPARNATTRVSVAVIGVPSQSANPPELSTDNSRRADVMESDPVGHAVAFITANDPDGDMLWYKIEGLFCLVVFHFSFFFLFFLILAARSDFTPFFFLEKLS
jgi:hypothetical protein